MPEQAKARRIIAALLATMDERIANAEALAEACADPETKRMARHLQLNLMTTKITLQRLSGRVED